MIACSAARHLLLLAPFLARKSAAAHPIVDVRMCEVRADGIRYELYRAGRSVSGTVVSRAIEAADDRHVVAEGESLCCRYVITGSTGRASATGDRRSNPIYARCGVAFPGECYVSLQTFFCERHATPAVLPSEPMVRATAKGEQVGERLRDLILSQRPGEPIAVRPTVGARVARRLGARRTR